MAQLMVRMRRQIAAEGNGHSGEWPLHRGYMTMGSKIWFARFLFYWRLWLRGYAPEGQKPKAASVQRSRSAPIVQLKPAAQAK